jgi:hypothetical protein
MMFTCDKQPDGYCSCSRKNLESGCGKQSDEEKKQANWDAWHAPTHVTVYKDGSYIAWGAYDAALAEGDKEPDWLCTIPLKDVANFALKRPE